MYKLVGIYHATVAEHALDLYRKWRAGNMPATPLRKCTIHFTEVHLAEAVEYQTSVSEVK